MSIAQINFLAVDNTHTKYLQGRDKKVWTNYKEALEANKGLDDFMNGLGAPDLKEGEEFDIPYKR